MFTKKELYEELTAQEKLLLGVTTIAVTCAAVLMLAALFVLVVNLPQLLV